MRKIIYSAVCLTALFVTSCTNDDIVIKALHTVNYNVTTQSMYETFDLVSDMLDFVRDQTSAISVKTYVYDADNQLVTSQTTCQYSLNTAKQEFQLEDGKYTFVTIETAVDEEDDYLPYYWEYTDTLSLKTLKISVEGAQVTYPYVLGVCTTEVNVSSNSTISASATPEAIGSLVELTYLDYDQSSYPYVGFGTIDITDSYSLDPSLSRDEKFNLDLTNTGYFMLRDKVTVSSESSIRHTRYLLDASIDWEFVFQKSENAGTTTYTHYSSNAGTTALEDGKTYYGGMSYNGDNTAATTYFGEKSGYDTWLDNLTHYTGGGNTSTISYIPDVYTTWGGTVSAVQTFMSGYNMYYGSTGSAEITSDGSYALGYDGNGYEIEIDYYFTSATTGLFETDVYYDGSTTSIDDLLAEVGTKYIELDNIYGYYYYFSSDYTTCVVVWGEESGYPCVSFIDADLMYAPSLSPNTKVTDRLNTNAFKGRNPLNNGNCYRQNGRANAKSSNIQQSNYIENLIMLDTPKQTPRNEKAHKQSRTLN